MPRTRLRFRQILHQGNADARLRRPEVYRTAGLSNLLCLRRTVIVSCMRRTERAARRRKQKRRRHVAARDGCRSIRDVERARGLRRFDFRGARSPEVPARCPSSSFPDEKVPARGGHRAKIRIIPDPAIVRTLFLAVRGPFRHPERPSEANRVVRQVPATAAALRSAQRNGVSCGPGSARAPRGAALPYAVYGSGGTERPGADRGRRQNMPVSSTATTLRSRTPAAA